MQILKTTTGRLSNNFIRYMELSESDKPLLVATRSRVSYCVSSLRIRSLHLVSHHQYPEKACGYGASIAV